MTADERDRGGQPPPSRHGQPRHPTFKRTRISGLWAAIAIFAVVLLLLLVFILENNHTVDIAYFGVHGHLPLGVAMLLAAVCGILLAASAAAARILQIRTAARRHLRATAKNPPVASPRPPADAGY